jgi:hypothetical protein
VDQDRRYCPQLLQCPPAQPAHPPPLGVLLATMRLPPPESLLMAAKTEIARRALGALQVGQAMGASSWLIGRSASNRFWHSRQ